MTYSVAFGLIPLARSYRPKCVTPRYFCLEFLNYDGAESSEGGNAVLHRGIILFDVSWTKQGLLRRVSQQDSTVPFGFSIVVVNMSSSEQVYPVLSLLFFATTLPGMTSPHQCHSAPLSSFLTCFLWLGTPPSAPHLNRWRHSPAGSYLVDHNNPHNDGDDNRTQHHDDDYHGDVTKAVRLWISGRWPGGGCGWRGRCRSDVHKRIRVRGHVAAVTQSDNKAAWLYLRL